MSNPLYQVTQGSSDSAADINQIVQCLTGLTQVSPGPLVQIATQSITTTVASVTFSNIPAYTNLFLTWSCRGDTSALTTGMECQVNADASSIYYLQFISGSNTTTSSGATVATTALTLGEIAAATSSNTAMRGVGWSSLPGWLNNSAYQHSISNCCVAFGTTAGTMTVETWAGFYASTAARTSLKLFPSAGNFAGTLTGGDHITLFGSM